METKSREEILETVKLIAIFLEEISFLFFMNKIPLNLQFAVTLFTIGGSTIMSREKFVIIFCIERFACFLEVLHLHYGYMICRVGAVMLFVATNAFICLHIYRKTIDKALDDHDEQQKQEGESNEALEKKVEQKEEPQKEANGEPNEELQEPRDESSQGHLRFYKTMYEKVANDLNEKSLKWDEEKDALSAKLSAINSWYEYYVCATYDYELRNYNLLEERNDLVAKLQNAKTSAEFYKACLDDSEDDCCKLREQNNNLSAKLFAETASVEHYYKLVKEMDEKNRKLEEEKTDLSAKLCAAKAACELYRSYIRDF